MDRALYKGRSTFPEDYEDLLYIPECFVSERSNFVWLFHLVFQVMCRSFQKLGIREIGVLDKCGSLATIESDPHLQSNIKELSTYLTSCKTCRISTMYFKLFSD